MGSNHTYKFLPSKGNHKQNEKTAYGLGVNICKQRTDKGAISKIYKWLIQLNNNKNQIP